MLIEPENPAICQSLAVVCDCLLKIQAILDLTMIALASLVEYFPPPQKE